MASNNGFLAGIGVFLLVAFIGLMGRWVYGHPKPKYGAKELKLLTVLAAGLPKDKALELRARLGDAGIRSAMSGRWDGRQDVLVFYGDIERAKGLLGIA